MVYRYLDWYGVCVRWHRSLCTVEEYMNITIALRQGIDVYSYDIVLLGSH